jgi:hypothetical protein
MEKRIKEIKEAAYGSKTYYIVVFEDKKSEVRQYLTKEMEKFIKS